MESNQVLKGVIESLPAKTGSGYADTDLIQLYANDGTPNGKIARSALMSCVKDSLGTLLNQGAADLGTSLAKIPALNSGGTLGSATVANLASVLGGTVIDLGSVDLNTVVKIGTYTLNGANVTNFPSGASVASCVMFVKAGQSSSFVTQELFVPINSGGTSWIRRVSTSGDATPWLGYSFDFPSFYKNYANLAALSTALGVDKRFEFVDMGLPSGTLWASKNLGADTITDYGAYFSWGNVQGQKPNGTTFPQTWGSGNETEPYVSSEGAALTGDIPLNLDAANYYLGGKAKMPTKDQFTELYNSSYTTNTWTTLHGVAGRLFTSKSNNNTIFFPASGRGAGTSLSGAGESGNYWSRSLQSSANGHYLYFDSSTTGSLYSLWRYYGLAVRAVL